MEKFQDIAKVTQHICVPIIIIVIIIIIIILPGSISLVTHNMLLIKLRHFTVLSERRKEAILPQAAVHDFFINFLV